jgi:ATPase family protein associated with various cellular activities (AAA)
MRLKTNHFSQTEHFEFEPTLYFLDHNPDNTIKPGLSFDINKDIFPEPSKNKKGEYEEELYEISLSHFKIISELAQKLEFTHLYKSSFVNSDNNCIITFYTRYTKQLKIEYMNSFNINSLIENDNFANILEKKEVISGIEFGFLAIRNNYPTISYNKIKTNIEIDIDNSYNLSYPLESVLESIKSDKSGLILFTGCPGAGKSSLIKYIAQSNEDLKFIFLNNQNIKILSDPTFTDFCINNLKESIIIIEDAELALASRDNSKSYDISTILNLTDGILGDILNLKIIATLNVTDKIDEALLRKGRLICKSDFGKISAKQANNLAKSLGKSVEFKEDIALCEVYNTENNGITENNKNKIGFMV